MAAGVSAFTNVVRLLTLAVVTTGGVFGWRAWNSESEHAQEIAAKNAELGKLRDDIVQKGAQIEKLSSDLASAKREVERLGLALKLMKVDRRMARVVVLDQAPSATPGRVRTRIRFEEVDASGNPVGTPRELALEGDVLYVDSLVVKFDDLLVEAGDPLRTASLCHFRRLFGEYQQPSDGVVLDAPGERPEIYGGSAEMSPLEQEIWRDFWNLANDPKRAAALGIRAAHGEAPSMKLKAGEVYRVTLRASGGLTMQPDRPDAAGN
jgi:hypothetical protein